MALCCEKKLVKQKSGLKIVPVNEAVQSPFLVNEPNWVPDSECSSCVSCQAKFDFFQRRHHCRRCGQCFCTRCCASKCQLPRMCFVDPVLHCDTCAAVSNREHEFFTVHMKTLMQGCVFFLTGSSFGEDAGTLCMCRLTSDQRFLSIEPQERNPFFSIEPIELRRVVNVRLVSSAKGPLGGSSVAGLAVQYSDPDEQPQDLQMMMVENNSRRQSAEWLAALQKALKMVLESRVGS